MFKNLFERIKPKKGGEEGTPKVHDPELVKSIKSRLEDLEILRMALSGAKDLGSGPDRGDYEKSTVSPEVLIAEYKKTKGKKSLASNFDISKLLSGDKTADNIDGHFRSYISNRLSSEDYQEFFDEYLEPLLADVRKLQEGLGLNKKIVEKLERNVPEPYVHIPLAVTEKEVDPGNHDPELVKNISSRLKDLRAIYEVLASKYSRSRPADLAPEVLIKQYEEMKVRNLINRFSAQDVISGELSGKEIQDYMEEALLNASSRAYGEINNFYLNPLMADIEKLSATE